MCECTITQRLCIELAAFVSMHVKNVRNLYGNEESNVKTTSTFIESYRTYYIYTLLCTVRVIMTETKF